MSEHQWLLLLSLLPDVGRKTMRHVLERQQVHRLSPREVLEIPVELLAEEYRLPSRAIHALKAELPHWLEQTEQLEAHLTRCGVRWISFQHAIYPNALEAMDDPPAILFAYGNWELLNQPTFALLASHTVSKQGLAVLESLAQGFLEQGWVPIASVNQPAYQQLALCAAREGAPLILVLDRGLLQAFGEDLRREPVALARIWQAEFDPQRALALSPFRPHDGWVNANGRYRDRLIAYLADCPVIVEARAGGFMQTLGMELLQKGRPLAVYAGNLERSPAHQALIEAGARPLCADAPFA